MRHTRTITLVPVALSRESPARGVATDHEEIAQAEEKSQQMSSTKTSLTPAISQPTPFLLTCLKQDSTHIVLKLVRSPNPVCPSVSGGASNWLQRPLSEIGGC